MPHVRSTLHFALVMLLSAAPAAAQYSRSAPPPPPQPRGGQSDNSSEAPAAPTPAPLADLIRAAACSVGRDPAPAVALLGTAPFSAEERSQAGNFVRGAQRCLRQREPLPTSPFTLRGAVAEALYEIQFATSAAARTPVIGAAPLARPTTGIEAATIQLLAPMYALADCTAPRHQDLVRAVLATEPRSPEEGTAFTALHPAFGACVAPGTRLTYDPRVMRSFLAEALYRWSVVQRDGAASPWAAAPAAAAAPGQ